MKVLFISENSFELLSDLKYYIQEYTIQNGTYPKQLDMTSEALDKYIDLFNWTNVNRNKLTFMGIKIHELK